MFQLGIPDKPLPDQRWFPKVPLHNWFEVLELERDVSEDALGDPPLRLSSMRH